MKQFFDDFTGTVLTSRGGVRFENGILIEERTVEKEKKYSGYGYHGGGRKAQGEEPRTCTMSIVCTQSEKAKIKELAEKENKTISAYCIEKILK